MNNAGQTRIEEDSSPQQAFESDVQRALSNLQEAIASVCEALPTYPRRAADLSRIVGLERNAAWKVFRLVNERDVFVAARFVPGESSINAFLTGAGAAGVAPDLLERVREAADGYQQVVRLHAGDRASAEIMLGDRSGEAGELGLRRSAFRSMSYMAGVRAQAQLQTFIFAPNDRDADMFDGVSLNGFVDIERVRHDAPVVVGRAMATDDEGRPLQPGLDEPIDPPSEDNAIVPLLTEFCSIPTPRFRRVRAERGFVENELAAGPVGRTGATTFMAGSIIRRAARRYRDPENATMSLVARVRTPTALFVCDALVHETVFGPAAPRVGIYADLFGDAMRRGPGSERYRLPSVVTPEYLGMGAGAIQTPDIPRYPRMLQHVFDRLSWDASRFRVHRVRIEFPFTPSSVVVTFDLPDTPPG